MTGKKMTVRERWYRLHRARRAFRREQHKQHARALQMGLDPVSLARLCDRSINPPIIIDPLLPRLV